LVFLIAYVMNLNLDFYLKDRFCYTDHYFLHSMYKCVTGTLETLQLWASKFARNTPNPPPGYSAFHSTVRPPPGSKDKTGVSNLGVDGKIIRFRIQILWAPQFTGPVQSNTTDYEMVGLLLPIVTLHRRLQNRQTVLMVDNEAIIWPGKKKNERWRFAFRFDQSLTHSRSIPIL